MSPAWTIRSRCTFWPFWRICTDPEASPSLVTTPVALSTSTPAMLPLPWSSKRELWTWRIAAAESFSSVAAAGREASGSSLSPPEEHAVRASATATATTAAARPRPHPRLDSIVPDTTGPRGPGPVSVPGRAVPRARSSPDPPDHEQDPDRRERQGEGQPDPPPGPAGEQRPPAAEEHGEPIHHRDPDHQRHHRDERGRSPLALRRVGHERRRSGGEEQPPAGIQHDGEDPSGLGPGQHGGGRAAAARARRSCGPGLLFGLLQVVPPEH